LTSALVVAAAVTWLIVPGGIMRRSIGFAGLLGLCFVVWYVAKRWLERRAAAERDVGDDFQEDQRRIEVLEVAEAKTRALGLLQDANRFRCEAWDRASVPKLDRLSPLLREVFARYRAIEVRSGESRVSLDDYTPSAVPGFLRIGGDEEGDYAITPGDETIYRIEVRSPGARPEIKPMCPTIYHWILLADLFYTVDER